MSGCKIPAAVVMMSILLLTAAVVNGSDDSSAEITESTLKFNVIGVDNLTVDTDSQVSFEIIVTNTNKYLDHDVSDNVLLMMYAEVVDKAGNAVEHMSAEIVTPGGVDYVNLEGMDTVDYLLTVYVGEYANTGDYIVNYYYAAKEVLGTTTTESGPLGNYSLSVYASNSPDELYNKIGGIWENPFSGILGGSWFAALLTFIFYVVIGMLLSFVFVPLVSRFMENDIEKRKSLSRSIRKLVILAVAVLSMTISLSVFGIGAESLDKVNSVCSVIYIAIAAFIVWRIYGALLDRTASRIQTHGDDEALSNFMSFKPLFLYIGEIVIALFTVFSIMGRFGFDLAAIVTSAGLVTLGITFGAQQIIAQFFAGLLLLTTRPFKKGDLIQLGSDTVYRVRKVNVMNTELENWSNTDITIVPNNTLTGSQVKNITRDTLRTRLFIYMDVGYASDLDKARMLMVESAESCPHVITDGSFPAPSTIITEFQDSNIEIRLSIWIDDYNIASSVGSDIKDAIYRKFNEAGIPIDYPQVVLHNARE